MEGLLIAARALHFAAAITLTGVFAFERLVSGPAFRQSGAAAARAAELDRRLGWLASGRLALALVSGAARLIAVAAGPGGSAPCARPMQGMVPGAGNRP